MSGGLTKGMARRLELLAGRPVFVPRLREFAVAVADLGPPGLPIGEQTATEGPGHRDPFLAVMRNEPRDVVIAALRLSDLLRDIADIGDAFCVELRPVVDGHDDIRTAARLYCSGDACLDVIGVDHLYGELDPQRLLAFRCDFGLEQLIGSRHEIGPPQPMNRRRVRVGGGPPRGQDPGHAARAGRDRAGSGKFQKPSPVDTRHDPASLMSRRISLSTTFFNSNWCGGTSQAEAGH